MRKKLKKQNLHLSLRHHQQNNYLKMSGKSVLIINPDLKLKKESTEQQLKIDEQQLLCFLSSQWWKKWKRLNVYFMSRHHKPNNNRKVWGNFFWSINADLKAKERVNSTMINNWQTAIAIFSLTSQWKKQNLHFMSRHQQKQEML